MYTLTACHFKTNTSNCTMYTELRSKASHVLHYVFNWHQVRLYRNDDIIATRHLEKAKYYFSLEKNMIPYQQKGCYFSSAADSFIN